MSGAAVNAVSRALSLEEKPTGRTTLLFVILSWLGILIVFGGSLWGDRILAPLDLGPTLYSKYKWMDPNLGGVPRNHYLIDMFDYGLPRTYLAHKAIQSGEFPWWEPYSDGGRPLAMEAHMSLTDPLRLLMFRLFSFVTAYNWTRILQCFLVGFSMFVLLRFLGYSRFITVLGALSFQFSGFQAMFFYPENVSNSIIYYPFLWTALAKYAGSRPVRAIAIGGLLCGGAILSGNQQSHAYLVLFLMCFAAAYASRASKHKLCFLIVPAGAFLVGCALAAPVLIPQIEMFMTSRTLGSRGIEVMRSGIYWLTGAFSLVGLFPWVAGSFRSLDLGKLLEQQGAGYAVHLGTPLLVLAVVGIVTCRNSQYSGRPEIRTALLLLLVYFVGICSTPMLNLLYQRAAGLAILALLVLSGPGLQQLLSQNSTRPRVVVRWVVILVTGAWVLAHVFAFVIYPGIQDRVLQMALKTDAADPYLGGHVELRTFQVNNLPNHITFRNPQPLLAFLGLLCLLALARGVTKGRPFAVAGMFLFNIVPLLSFFGRFTPNSPIAYWHALLEGGPEQKAVMRAVGHELRMRESSTNRYSSVFPAVTVGYYGIHSLDGWTSFPLLGPGQTQSSRDYNVLYTSAARSEHGEIKVLSTNQVRFRWIGDPRRDVSIVAESANAIRVRLAPGTPGELVRTDTYYPGWRVESPAGIRQQRTPEGFWSFRVPRESLELILRYEPSYSVFTKLVSIVALLLIAVMLVTSLRRQRVTSSDLEGSKPAEHA